VRAKVVTSVVLAAAAGALALAPGAGAAKHHPGHHGLPPGLDQYVEHLPGAGGNKPTGHIHIPHGAGSVPPGTAAALRGDGRPGAAAAALAAATAPHRGGRGGGNDGGRSSAIADVLGGSGGMGVVFPILLAAAALAVGLALAVRRRHHAPLSSDEA
jgi:hypothetical protein